MLSVMRSADSYATWGWVLTLVLLMASSTVASAAQSNRSKLWGDSGELWTPKSRLPDFSYAGYQMGEAPIPDLPVVANVKDFGAKGDGVTDDTHAFLKAISETDKGAIFIPPGRYVITRVLLIEKSNIVLRGAGEDQTVLYFPKPLEAMPVPAYVNPACGEGRGAGVVQGRGNIYGRSGLWCSGHRKEDPGTKLADVTAGALRGESALRVSSTPGIRPGQMVRLVMYEDAINSLASHLYGNLSAPADSFVNLINWTDGRLVDWATKIRAVKGTELILDRPLRTDVRLEWKPQLYAYRPTVQEVGIEDLKIEFPNVQYASWRHPNDPGYNGISFQDVHNCWVRNVTVVDSDRGIDFSGSKFCTAQAVTLSAKWRTGRFTGHHGLRANMAQDCLFTSFRIATNFDHDITSQFLSNGNVFSGGELLDPAFDQHGEAPFENLYSDISMQGGSRFWTSSGRRNAGARQTFWNIRIANGGPGTGSIWGKLARIGKLALGRSRVIYPQPNFVGVQRVSNPADVPELEAHDAWIEALDPLLLTPRDLHKAQLGQRLKRLRGSSPRH